MEHPAETPVGISANSQLEVCKLLHSGGVVIYPGGLNGGLEPVQVTLLKLPLWEMGSTNKDMWLWITFPRTTQEDSLEAVPLQLSTLVSSPHSVTECPSKVVTDPSLTEEIADLLSNPMFEMPGESSTCNSPIQWLRRREPPNPGEVLQGYLKQPPPSPHGSSQVDTANIRAHSSCSLLHGTLERDTSPTPLLLLANSINLSNDVLHLQEEMNDPMVNLLSARATIDMHCKWVLSETEVGHCQNEIDTSKAIREIKALVCPAMIGDAKAAYGTTIRKVEAICLASTSKAEVIWATRIRKAKAANAVQASKLQWQHQEAMQNLEEEALKEKCTHQSFLWACGVALQACPNDTLAKLMYPCHQLMGSPSLPGPLMVTSPLTAMSRNPITSSQCPSRPVTIVPSPRAKWCWSPEQEAEVDCPGEWSQPHKGGERKIPWWDTWGIPAMRPSVRIQNWFNK